MVVKGLKIVEKVRECLSKLIFFQNLKKYLIMDGKEFPEKDADKVLQRLKMRIEKELTSDTSLISSQEKKKRILLCLQDFSLFLKRFNASECSQRLYEDFFQCFHDFVQRRDVDNEYLPSIVKLYYDLGLIALKAGFFELALRTFSLALGMDDGLHADKIMKQFVFAKYKAKSSNLPSLQFLEKTSPEFLDDLRFKLRYDPYDLLCQEYCLYKQQNSLSWCHCAILQIFEREKESLRRAHGFLMLAKILYEDNSLHDESPFNCCGEALRLLTYNKNQSVSKWKLLCEAYVWKHLCFMQEKRNVSLDETMSSLSSDKDLFDGGKKSKSFEMPLSKILCSLSDFDQTFVCINEAVNIWNAYLSPQFDSLENSKDKNDLIELCSVLARLLLLIPKPDLALKTLLWLISKRTSFVDWYSLVMLFYDCNEYCRSFFAQNFGSLGTPDSCVLSIIRMTFYCSVNEVNLAMNEYVQCEKALSQMEKTTSFYRLLSMVKYASVCFLRLPFNKIPEQFKSVCTSTVGLLSDCYSKAFGLLKVELGSNEDASKMFSTATKTDGVVFDTVWCLRRIYDLATSFDHCSLPAKALVYFSEGYDLSRRLGYPYWTLLFLNSYLRVVFLSNDKTYVLDCLESARNFFGTESLANYETSMKNCRKVVKSELDVRKITKKSMFGFVENVRRDARLKNDLIFGDISTNASLISTNRQTFDYIRHSHSCMCSLCSDFLLSSAKDYFLHLLERYYYKMEQLSCAEIDIQNLAKYGDLMQNVIDENSDGNVLVDQLKAPNIVSNYCYFLIDFWVDLVRFMFFTKRYSQVGELLVKISTCVFQSDNSRYLTNPLCLLLNFWKAKFASLSTPAVDLDEATNEMASLSLKSNKVKKDYKKTLCKQSGSALNVNKLKPFVETVENDLKNFGHLLYYPWYREANEFIVSQRLANDALSTVLHFVELFGVSVRHSAFLAERAKGMAGNALSDRLRRIENVQQLRSIVKAFPKDLTLLFLYLSTDNELVLARLSPRCDPIVVSLGMVVEKFDALSTIKEIRTQISGSVDGLDKREFWSKRNDINSRLENFAETLERTWFNAFRALLIGFRNDENLINENSDSIPSSVFEILTNAAEILNENEFELLSRQLCVSFTKSAQKRLLNKLKFGNMFSSDVPNGPVVLVLDKDLHCLPFEAMPIFKDQPVSRSVSLHALADSIENWRLRKEVDRSSVYFVLNPSRDLVNTQMFFENSFIDSGWSGCAGKQPSSGEIESALTQKDLFIYCGHGGGSHYVSGNLKQVMCRSSVILMGCSSGKYLSCGAYYEPTGNISLYQIAMCPSVVGCLWEVTDRDIDTYLEYVLCSWLRYKDGKPKETYPKNKDTRVPDVLSLPEAVAKSRQFCKLNYLTGAAPVVYGLPVEALR